MMIEDMSDNSSHNNNTGADATVQCNLEIPLKNKRYHEAMNALFEKLDFNQELCMKQFIYETIFSVVTVKDYPVNIDLDWLNGELSNGGALLVTNEEQELIRGLVAQVMMCKQKLYKAQSPLIDPTFANILLQGKVDKKTQLDMVNESIKRSIYPSSDSVESIEHRESSHEEEADGDSTDREDTHHSSQNTGYNSGVSTTISSEADRCGDAVVKADLTPSIDGGSPTGDKPTSPNAVKGLVARLPRLQTVLATTYKVPLSISLLQLLGSCPPNSPSSSSAYSISQRSATGGATAYRARSSSPLSSPVIKPDSPPERVRPSTRVASAPKAPALARGAAASSRVQTSARVASSARVTSSARVPTSARVPISARVPTSARVVSTTRAQATRPPKSLHSDKATPAPNTQSNLNGSKGNVGRPRRSKASDIPRYTRKFTGKNTSGNMAFKEPTAVPPGSLASVVTAIPHSPRRVQRPAGSRIPAIIARPRQPPKPMKSAERLSKPKQAATPNTSGKHLRQFHN